MLRDQYQTLFDYHWHNNQLMLEKAAGLAEVDYYDNPGYGHGSVHDLLFHVLQTDKSWRMALETGRQVSGIRPMDFPDINSLRSGFMEEQVAWEAALDNLDDSSINATVDLTNWRGETSAIPRWVIFQHLVLHGMQHQTELAQLLTARGQSPGDIDFIFFA